MNRIAIGLLLAAFVAPVFAQQQTPDCQDQAFALGYRRDEPSFAKRTEVSHGRDPLAGQIAREPIPVTFAEIAAKKYGYELMPEFEQGGKRLPPEEMQVWSLTGNYKIGCSSNLGHFGTTDKAFSVCDPAGTACVCVSMSPPECVGDSVFSPEILALWEKDLKKELPTTGLVTVTGPGYWCCQNSIRFNIKPVLSVTAAVGGGGGGGPDQPAPAVPPDVTINLPAIVLQQPVALGSGQSNEFNVTTSPIPGFNGPVDISVWTDAQESDNFSVTVTPSHIPAPGTGTSTVSINTSPSTFPRDYYVTITATANGKTSNSSFIVSVQCDPPVILGIDQPRDATVNPGVRATFAVRTLGTGPFQYQWYRGHRGSTNFPIAGATSERLEVTGTDDMNLYWVRVTNACGTVDSTTTSIAPSRLRAIRR